jgi:tetratricopeptide (TPR) repeat protein
MCQDTGLADSAAGIVAYRRSLELDERALRLDSNYMHARSGLASMHLHIGNAELDDDAPEALDEFRIAIQLLDALPGNERSKLPLVRLRAILLRKQAVALSELGEYSSAVPLFGQAVQVFQRLVDADSKDTRALGDLKRVLDDEAICFENAANPALAAIPADRSRNLRTAGQLLEQEASTIRQLAKQDTAHDDWEPELANVLVRLGAVRWILHQPVDSEAMWRDGLAVVKRFAVKQQPTTRNLELAITAILNVEPASLRDPKLAINWAERGIVLTHRKSVVFFLKLALARRANGQPEEAIIAAREGLALLPPVKSGRPVARVRKLLEIEAQAGF